MISNANAVRIPLKDKSVHCCVTSPPYMGLRDYQLEPTPWPAVSYAPLAGLPEIEVPPTVCCLGLEPTIEAYVGHLVSVFREVWRVLRDDGTAWLNLGDSFATSGGSRTYGSYDGTTGRGGGVAGNRRPVSDLKPKDLMGVPWRVALALQADGWYLRSDIIWAKSNPMPESVTDRPTKAHEYVFLLAKSERYFYDNEAVKEANANPERTNYKPGKEAYTPGNVHDGSERTRRNDGFQAYANGKIPNGRNRRSVWSLPTAPFKGAHFAVFPPALVEPMIKAGTSQAGCCAECGAPHERVIEKSGEVKRRWSANDTPSGDDNWRRDNGRDTQNTYKTTGWRPTCDHAAETVPAIVLDPFAGSGTTGQVARELGRDFIGLDLNAEYLARHALPRAEQKTSQAAIAELPLFNLNGAAR